LYASCIELDEDEMLDIAAEDNVWMLLEFRLVVLLWFCTVKAYLVSLLGCFWTQ